MMAGTGDEWKFLCIVRGYHVYKDILLVGLRLAITFEWVLSGSPHRSLDCLPPPFGGYKRSNDVFLRTIDIIHGYT